MPIEMIPLEILRPKIQTALAPPLPNTSLWTGHIISSYEH